MAGDNIETIAFDSRRSPIKLSIVQVIQALYDTVYRVKDKGADGFYWWFSTASSDIHESYLGLVLLVERKRSVDPKSEQTDLGKRTISGFYFFYLKNSKMVFVFIPSEKHKVSNQLFLFLLWSTAIIGFIGQTRVKFNPVKQFKRERLYLLSITHNLGRVLLMGIFALSYCFRIQLIFYWLGLKWN